MITNLLNVNKPNKIERYYINTCLLTEESN